MSRQEITNSKNFGGIGAGTSLQRLTYNLTILQSFGLGAGT